MKKILKSIGIVGALCFWLSSGTAFANSQHITGWTASGSGWGSVFGSDDINRTDDGIFGFFTDSYLFAMPTALQAVGGAVVITGFGPDTSLGVGPSTYFTQFELRNDTTNTSIAGGSTFALFDNFSFIAPAGTDTYELIVSGGLMPNHDFGAYSGSLLVTAVPEPETYAMLLAGLGLIGFSLRRRRMV